MDYKLKALHKSYQSRCVAWVVSFIAGFTIAAALIITAAFLKSDVIAIIGGSWFLILIVAFAIMCFTNCTTPEWLEKAEQEYQRELLKIKLEKQLKEEQAKKEFEDKLRAEMTKMNARVKAVDYIIEHMESLEALIDGTKQKQSTVDKKLSGKKK